MKRLFALLAFCAASAFAQTISDVQALVTVAASQLTALQTVTGTDGTVCTFYKVPSTTIDAYFACSNGTNLLRTVQLQSSGASTTYWPLGQGAQLWYVFANPTTTAWNCGSFGTAPASGITWTAIPGPGGTTVTGTKTWP